MNITDEQTGELISTTLEQMRDVQIKVKMMQECMDLSESATKDMILTLLKGESVNLTELANSKNEEPPVITGDKDTDSLLEDEMINNEY